MPVSTWQIIYGEEWRGSILFDDGQAVMNPSFTAEERTILRQMKIDRPEEDVVLARMLLDGEKQQVAIRQRLDADMPLIGELCDYLTSEINLARSQHPPDWNWRDDSRLVALEEAVYGTAHGKGRWTIEMAEFVSFILNNKAPEKVRSVIMPILSSRVPEFAESDEGRGYSPAAEQLMPLAKEALAQHRIFFIPGIDAGGEAYLQRYVSRVARMMKWVEKPVQAVLYDHLLTPDSRFSLLNGVMSDPTYTNRGAQYFVDHAILPQLGKKGPPITLLAHSFGGAFCLAVQNALRQRLEERGMDRGEIQKAFNGLRIVALGFPLVIFPEHKDLPQIPRVHVTSVGDMVPPALPYIEGMQRQLATIKTPVAYHDPDHPYCTTLILPNGSLPAKMADGAPNFLGHDLSGFLDAIEQSDSLQEGLKVVLGGKSAPSSMPLRVDRFAEAALSDPRMTLYTWMQRLGREATAWSDVTARFKGDHPALRKR